MDNWVVQQYWNNLDDESELFYGLRVVVLASSEDEAMNQVRENLLKRGEPDDFWLDANKEEK